MGKYTWSKRTELKSNRVWTNGLGHFWTNSLLLRRTNKHAWSTGVSVWLDRCVYTAELTSIDFKTNVQLQPHNKAGLLKFFSHQIGMPWCEIAKYEIAKITNKYFRDKLQNFHPQKPLIIRYVYSCSYNRIVKKKRKFNHV